jgi:hypothetical protein
MHDAPVHDARGKLALRGSAAGSRSVGIVMSTLKVSGSRPTTKHTADVARNDLQEEASMLIDEPSSSSPADGDASSTEPRPPVARRASVPASSDRGRAGAWRRAAAAAQALAGSSTPRPAQALAGSSAPRPAHASAGGAARAEHASAGGAAPRADLAPAGGLAPRAELAPAGDPAPRAELAPAGDLAPRDPGLIETAGAPAPEALRATAVAAAVVRELYESGREVRFAFAPSGKRVTVLLCDMDGAVLSRLTPARALEIATGEPAPGGRRR